MSSLFLFGLLCAAIGMAGGALTFAEDERVRWVSLVIFAFLLGLQGGLGIMGWKP